MLSRLILLVLQAIVAWVAAPPIIRYIPGLGGLQLLVYAVVFAVLVWVVGLVLSQVLRDAGMPSSATLVASLVLALIAAAIYTWLPIVVPEAKSVMLNLQEKVYPLLGALIGYHIKR
jgi:hypothetical protein